MDRRQERTIGAAGKWAVHVESSRQIMRDWAGIHEEHDIQFAAATDGGRQPGDEGVMVASAAAFRDDGSTVGRVGHAGCGTSIEVSHRGALCFRLGEIGSERAQLVL